MDLDTHFRYEGLVTALPDPEQSQVARDLRRERLKALGDNATLSQAQTALEALNTRFEHDLCDEREERAKDIARLSHEHDTAVADVVHQLDAAQEARRHLQDQVERLDARIQQAEQDKQQAEKRAENFSNKLQAKSKSLDDAVAQLSACRDALRFQERRAAELASTLAAMQNIQPEDARAPAEGPSIQRTNGGVGEEQEETHLEAEGTPVIPPPPIEPIEEEDIPPTSPHDHRFPEDDVDDVAGGQFFDGGEPSPSPAPSPAPSSAAPSKRSRKRQQSTESTIASSTRRSTRLSSVAPRSATPNSQSLSVDVYNSRKGKRPANWDGDSEPSSQRGKRPRNSGFSAHTALGSSYPAPQAIDSEDKLNIKCFVESNALSTIWDQLCKVDLAPIEHVGIEYEIGDMNHWGDTTDGVISEESKQLPCAWTGVLCDYSTKDPYKTKRGGRTGREARPAYTKGARVEWVAIMWLFSLSDIETTIGGTVEWHGDVEIDDEENFNETFLGSDVPKNQRFFTTELEWMGIWNLCVRTNDIGCSKDSNRAIFVDWAGPVVDHEEEWRQDPPSSTKSRGSPTLVRRYGVKEGSGLRENDFPEGWIHE